MMRLLRSWRDSLLLLAPQNFKLFALVTLKSTFEMYKALARVWHFWVLPLIVLMQQLYFGREDFAAQFMVELSVPYYIMMCVLYIWLAVWVTVTFCLATRSSIGQKNLYYFDKYKRFTLMIAFVVILLWQLIFWWNRFFVSFHYGLTSAVVLAQVLNFFVRADFIPLWIFFILFFLDSDGSVKQLWYAAIRAVKMTIYNLPLLLVLMFIFSWPAILFPKYIVLHGALQHAVAFILYVFLLKPLLINIWTNIYIKKFHEMPELYFNQPK